MIEHNDSTRRELPESADGLEAGEEGWWPVIGAVVLEVRVGDRVTTGKGTTGEEVAVIAEVREGNAVQVRLTDTDGNRFTIGVGYHLTGNFQLDRPGTHATLGEYVR